MVRRATTHAGILLAGLILLSACGGGGSGSCIDEGEAVGLVITISCADPPTKPFYIWDSAATVTLLEVRRTATENVVAWSLLTTGDSLEAPLRHGQIPPTPVGTFMDGDETDLEVGVEYRVTLFDAGQAGVVGQRTFTVLP